MDTFFLYLGVAVVFAIGILAGSLLTLPRRTRKVVLPKDWEPSERIMQRVSEHLAGMRCEKCGGNWLICDCETPPPEPRTCCGPHADQDRLPLYRYDDDGQPYMPHDGGAV